MDSVKTSLVNGDNVYLRGFGTFAIKKRAKKTARNITKNTTIVVPEHYGASGLIWQSHFVTEAALTLWIRQYPNLEVIE